MQALFLLSIEALHFMDPVTHLTRGLTHLPAR